MYKEQGHENDQVNVLTELGNDAVPVIFRSMGSYEAYSWLQAYLNLTLTLSVKTS